MTDDSQSSQEESGPQYRSLFENASDGIFILDEEGRILKANRAARDRLDYRNDELIGLQIGEIDSPEMKPSVAGRIARIKSDGYSVFESEHMARDGKRIPVEVNCRTIEYKGKQAMLAVVRDITERKRAEALVCIQRDVAVALSSTSDLTEAMNRLLELACKMAAIDCGAVYIIDPQTGTANLAAQRGLTPGFVGLISSYAPDSPQVERARAGKTTCGRWEETRVSQDPAMDSEGLRGLISTPIFYNGELIAVLSLASHRTAGIPVATQHAVEAIAAVAGGTLVRIRAETALLIAVTQDISERRRAEAELRRYAETQATLLREVNHRVKNNLAAILSIVHKEEDLALTRGADSSVPMLRDLAARLQALAIVHQLLSGSAWRPLSLSELCENIIRSAMKSVHLNSPGDVIVQNSGVEVGSSEAHHLALVINELAINSLKHGTAGGRPVRIEVGIEADETSTTLHFRDDGPGYPAKILSEPSSTLGTGMDLVIGIIRKSLRGTLSLANKGGARATITFPNSLSDAELRV